MFSLSMKRLLGWPSQGVKTIFRTIATATHEMPSPDSPPAKKYSITGKERREVPLVSQDKPVGALQYVL
jgi:hypothetical protein